MKNIKVLICALLCVCGIIAYSDVSYAAELAPDNELGVTEYNLEAVFVNADQSALDYAKVSYNKGIVKADGYSLVFVREDKGKYYDYTLYRYNQYGYEATTFINGRASGITSVGNCLVGNMYKDSGQWYQEPSSYSYMTYSIMRQYHDFIDICKFITNIPVFDNLDIAISFMTNDGNASIKDAINYEEISPCIYGDLEVPQEVKLDLPGGSFFSYNDNYKLTWTQTDEKYMDWDTEILIYHTFRGRQSLLFVPLDDWITYENKLIYSEVTKCRYLRYAFTSKDVFDWQNKWINENAMDDGVNELEELELFIFMRNKYFDGTKTHYSNWIKVSVDCLGNGVYVDEENASGVVEEFLYDSQYSEENNDYVNNMPSGVINPDSDYDGTEVQVGNSATTDSLVGYVTNGFGLLGDSGLIACIEDVLSFVPDFVWGIIGAGISIMIIIALVKFVF